MRALGGTRRWPDDVPAVTFLAGIIRSIAWSRRRALAQERRAEPLLEAQGKTQLEAEAKKMAAKIDVSKILSWFADDPVATKILYGQLAGLEGVELKNFSGIEGQVDFDSKRRMIRRKIESLLSLAKERVFEQ
jgi:hypothetical protein